MYASRKKRFDWGFLLNFSDIVAFCIALLCTPYLGHVLGTLIVVPVWWELLILLACHLSALRFFEAYSWDTFVRPRAIWKSAPPSVLAAVVLFLGLHSFLRFPYWSALQIFVSIHGVCFIFILVALRAFDRWLVLKRLKLAYLERLVVIDMTPRLHRVIKGMAQAMAGNLEVLGIITSSPYAAPEIKQGSHTYKILGNFSDFEKILHETDFSMVLADSDTMEPTFQTKMLEAASRNQIACRLIPSSFDVWASRLTIRHFAGVPVIGVSVIDFDKAHNRMIKRLVDIIGAIVGLLLFGPIMLICALLIYKESPGPVLYRQIRLGRNNTPFKILKLRSMKLDAEANNQPGWTVENDPRRLRIGEFLRKWNLDELPQFWNVLVGEMSLVGPRPERPEYVKDFEHTIRHYNLRTIAKPGITGWAAVHGLRGNTSLVDRLTYDLYYIENWSLLLDFGILILTLFPPKNAY